VQVRHRAFVLVPEDRSDRVFTDYHRAHRHAAGTQEADAPAFDIPAAGERYPRSSLPALEAAAWVRTCRPALFPAFDLATFEAFFGRTEDISDAQVLGRIGESGGLDPSSLRTALSGGHYRSMVVREHLGAVELGIQAVPAVLIPGREPIVGAVSYEVLRRAAISATEGTAQFVPLPEDDESRGGDTHG